MFVATSIMAAAAAARNYRERQDFQLSDSCADTNTENISYYLKLIKYFEFPVVKALVGDFKNHKIITAEPRTLGISRSFYLGPVQNKLYACVENNLDTYKSYPIWHKAEQEAVKLYLDWLKETYDLTLTVDKIQYKTRFVWDIIPMK